ncbi:MAG: serine protease [Phycisphaerae bacterium]|jgi:S1-C subfamily serine protease|nr:serine protease [Phycisphaerae bacterium]HPP19243.1 serine protease [Phycisphaerae bacterium]HQE41645.1 serine protease [Phycisphaerae bacterium]HXK84454.1 serine protease [Phycisphaerae bacterium]
MSSRFSVLSSQFLVCIAALVAILCAGARVSAAEAPSYDPERFMAEKSPALVTIKFNLRSSAGEDNEQSETEITGVVIDPQGLVLCSNVQLTGLAAAFSGVGFQGSAVPTNIRVLVGEDPQGLKAKLLARDTELDLAWIRLTEKPPAPLASIDLAKAAKPRIGQRVVSLRRMGKYFDRVPVIREVQVSARTRKPRELYILGGSINTDFGLPVFTTSGEVIGIMILPISDENEEELRGNPFAMLGGISGILDMFGGVVLPADEVLRATRRAQESPESESAADAPRATTRPAVEDVDEESQEETDGN